MPSFRTVLAIITTVIAIPIGLVGFLFTLGCIGSLERDGKSAITWIALVGSLLTIAVAGAFLVAAWTAVAGESRAASFARVARRSVIPSENGTLMLQDGAAPIGGTMRGRIDASGAFAGVQLVTVTLTMLVQNEDADGVVTEVPMWQESREVAAPALVPHPGGVSIPVEIPVTAAAEPSNTTKLNGRIVWRLFADASMHGEKYHASFEVPVARTEGSPAVAQTTFAKALAAPFIETVDANALTAPRPAFPSVDVRDTPRGLELAFPRCSNRSTALVPLAVAAALVALTVIMFEESRYGMALLVVPFVAFCGYVGTDALLASSIVIVGKRSVEITRRLISESRSFVPVGQIAGLQILMGGSSGSRSTTPKSYYTLALLTRDGKRMTLGKYVAKPEAEWLAGQIMKRLPLSP